MIYSVYNYDDRSWDYYEGVGSFPATGFFRKPCALTHLSTCSCRCRQEHRLWAVGRCLAG